MSPVPSNSDQTLYGNGDGDLNYGTIGPWCYEPSDVQLMNREPLPRISVIIPSYNQGAFLETTLRSIIYQDYPNTEIIIVDGGSSDESISIIRKYEAKISYWVSEPDNGQSHALSKGFARATGEIVAWQNSDDIYLPGAFWKVINIFRKRPEVGLVYGNIYVIDVHNMPIREVRYCPITLKSLPYLKATIPTQALFWRRRGRSLTLREDLRYSMDFDLFFQLLASRQPAHIREFLGGMRWHESSKSATIACSIGQEERRAVLRSQMYETESLRFKLMRIQRQIAKTLWHIGHGEVAYIFRELRGRLLCGLTHRRFHWGLPI